MIETVRQKLKENSDREVVVECDVCEINVVDSRDLVTFPHLVPRQMVAIRSLCSVHEDVHGHSSFTVNLIEPVKKVDMNITVNAND